MPTIQCSFSNCLRRAVEQSPFPETKATTPHHAIPLRGYRRAMAKAMAASTHIPLFHLHDEVNVSFTKSGCDGRVKLGTHL
jgi:hypothetical protein